MCIACIVFAYQFCELLQRCLNDVAVCLLCICWLLLCLKLHLSSVLQQNEIDLNALLLMSEQDFAEIGLPAVSHDTHVPT